MGNAGNSPAIEHLSASECWAMLSRATTGREQSSTITNTQPSAKKRH